MGQKEQRTVFLHKNSLAKGIQEVKLTVENNNGLLSQKVNGCIHCYHRSEYSDTLEEAIDKAESMRLAKIKSLKKQLERLENMVFV
jgi:Ni,Fe-hydrogenase III large subunit